MAEVIFNNFLLKLMLYGSLNFIDYKRLVALPGKGRNWLNDNIIELFFKILQKDVGPKIYITNTFFWTVLKKNVDQDCTRLCQRFDMFLYERIFIPINHSNQHWALAVIGNN